MNVSEDGLMLDVPPADDAESWEGPASAPGQDEALYLELDGWEGPLVLLLDLARRQKVDLRQISILALVDQYLTYIDRAEALRLELAADYLVMAAWLLEIRRLLMGHRAMVRFSESNWMRWEMWNGARWWMDLWRMLAGR